MAGGINESFYKMVPTEKLDSDVPTTMMPAAKTKGGRKRKRKTNGAENGISSTGGGAGAAAVVASSAKIPSTPSPQASMDTSTLRPQPQPIEQQCTAFEGMQDDDLLMEVIDENEIFVDLTLARAQIFKNFLDRIRHQNSDLPLMFRKDGLYIQSMEPGKQAWVHAQILADGCLSYAYNVDEESLFLTLEFKSIFANVKSIDANDQLRIRVLPNLCKDPIKRKERYNVSLICMNDKNKLTSEWILDTIGDELINSKRMEARISDYWDCEYRVSAPELQRRITMYSANKIQSLYFICQGYDLIIKQKDKFKTSMVKGVTTEFIDAFVRGPSTVSPDVLMADASYWDDEEHTDRAEEQEQGAAMDVSDKVSESSSTSPPDVARAHHPKRRDAPVVPIIVPVELKHLVNACKGSSTNNNSKQMIHLRISNDLSQDILIEESVGDVGKLTLGVSPMVVRTKSQ